jgi:hypothetical protein
MNHCALTRRRNAMALALVVFTLCAPNLVRAQINKVAVPNRPLPASSSCPSCCTMPVSERTGEEGCYVLANNALDSLPPGPLY